MAQNDFLEGVRKGMMAYMATRKQMQDMQSGQLNQQYMQAMTQRMQEPQQPAWDQTPEGYRQRREIDWEIDNRGKTEQPAPDIGSSVNEYNKQLEGTGYRGVYNPITGKLERVKIATGGRGSGESESGGYDPKAIASAHEMVQGIMDRYIVKKEGDEDVSLEPLREKMVNILMSGDGGYERAVGYLRFYQMAQGHPELNDPAMNTPLPVTDENGQEIPTDPQEYIVGFASKPGVTDAQIEEMINNVISYYGTHGLLQNPTQKWVQGPEPPTSYSIPRSDAFKGLTTWHEHMRPGASNIFSSMFKGRGKSSPSQKKRAPEKASVRTPNLRVPTPAQDSVYPGHSTPLSPQDEALARRILEEMRRNGMLGYPVSLIGSK